MGPTGNGLCVTCGKTVVTCPGHFGHIRLAKPIYHPLFITGYPRFCMNYLPVLPHCARPRTISGDDDLTLQYVQILKLNKRIGEGEGDLLGTLFKNVHALMANSNGLVKMGMHSIKGIE